MAESFEQRVNKLFGSQLFDTVPANSFPTSSWSVAAGEVERRSWNRGGGSAVGGGPDDRENDPCASAFDDEDGCFGRKARIATKQRRKNDWEGGDYDHEEDDEEGGRGDDYEEIDEIRASVGLDPTLDREEEEDEYDRRAFNKENTGDRVFMREIMDHGPYLNIHSVVPDSIDDPLDEIHEDFNKDPRADHFAATVRLNEDKNSEKNGHRVIAGCHEDSSMLLQTSITDSNIKPILKRKESPVESKPKKRVRFDPGCIGDHLKDIEEAKDVPMVALETSSVREETSFLPAESARIPDYLKNPTRYTCYTLSQSDKDDNEAKKQQFNDFRQSNLDQHESSTEIPQSITFTSRKKKTQDAMLLDDSTSDICDEPHKQVSQLAACTIGISAGENDECEMEDDETFCKGFNGQRANIRASRNYRPKPSSDNST